MTAYWGPEPRMPISAIAWIHPGGPVSFDDVMHQADLHWSLWGNMAENFTDPRARSLQGGGRAFVHRWVGIDSLTVRADVDARWTLFVVSTRQSEELAAELMARGAQLWAPSKARSTSRPRRWPRG